MKHTLVVKTQGFQKWSIQTLYNLIRMLIQKKEWLFDFAHHNFDKGDGRKTPNQQRKMRPKITFSIEKHHQLERHILEKLSRQWYRIAETWFRFLRPIGQSIYKKIYIEIKFSTLKIIPKTKNEKKKRINYGLLSEDQRNRSG
jgi:hypothetical protein